MLKLFLGTIYTSFKPLRKVEALLIAGERVVYAGSADRAESICKEFDCEVYNLGWRVALPGFIDAHAHLDGLGLALNTIDLRDVKSIEELKHRLRLYAEKFSTWVLGRGWDQELFAEHRYPTRWDLDEAVPDKPVLITRVCGHVGVVNSRALELLKLSEKFKDNPNLVKDENGLPTGIVREEVLSYIRESIEFDTHELKKFLLDAQRHALELGVTTIGFVSVPLRLLPILFELHRRNMLNIRLRLYLEPRAINVLADLGVRGPFGDDMLRIQGVKTFVDGSLGGRTAWLSKPYSDDPSTSGVPTIAETELADLAKHVAELGLQLAVHAIGDRALDLVLRVYESLGEAVRRNRFRIEHVSLVRDDQLDRLSNLGAIAVVQPHFVITDWWVVKRVGVERARWVYRFRSMLERGIPLAFSTDAPVEPINPWETVYAAIERGEKEGIELAKLTPSEKIDLATALHLYTYGSAYAVGSDNLGALEPGFYADIVVVDRDPLTVSDPIEVAKIRVLATFVGGKKVYSQ